MYFFMPVFKTCARMRALFYPLQATNSQTDQEARYRGVLDALVRILKTEGVLGFFKGMKVS
jgi:hypothetical protein